MMKPEKEKWLKRFGFSAFLFFLIKGILWLFVFYGAGKLLGCNF